MSYKYSFCDNMEYGAEDVNGIVQRLVASGVADPFADGVAYNASKLNDVNYTVYDPGVVPSSVTTLQVTKQSDGVVSVAPGLAFFANGSTIEVTSAETLSYEQGVKNYVYVKQDLAAQNRNYPACTTSAPAGDFVLLAEISADGTVTDKRKYARGKVPGYQSNANVCLVVEKSFRFDMSEGDPSSGTETFDIDMGANNYSYVFSVDSGSTQGRMGRYSMSDGSYFSVSHTDNTSYDEVKADCLIVGDRGVGELTFVKTGSVLKATLDWNLFRLYTKKTTISFTLYLC